MNGWRFRPLARSDFHLLAGWLATPHVARWWADDPTPAALEADYGACIDGTEPAEVFIALHAGEPLGLVQRYALAAYPEYLEQLAPWLHVAAGAWSIDYLIGPEASVGRGLGTGMVAAFTTCLWADVPAASGIVVPVHADNRASWRTLERAGFRFVARADLEPDNPADSPDHRIYGLERPTTDHDRQPSATAERLTSSAPSR